MRRLIASGLLLLTACGAAGPAAPSGTTGSDAPVIDGAWQLRTGRGPSGEIPIVAGHPVTLTVSGTRIGGVAACNSYGARFAFTAAGVRVEELAMTAVGCEEPIVASEAAYAAALTAVNAVGLEGEELVLRGDGLELRFAPLPPPPTADVVDTVWVLETLFVGDVAASASGEEATLELRSDGTLHGSTGCRAFTGTWIEQGDQIVATSLAMDDRECAVDDRTQDGQVVSVIGDGFVPSVDGELLTLNDPGGVGLVYRAGAE